MKFTGVYAANVCLFGDDFAIDHEALSEHVASIAAIDGIAGLLTNGHAGENYYLTQEEKRQVLEVVCGSVDRTSCQIIAGINAESSAEAAMQAVDAERAGADALLIFPPFSWATSRSRDEVIRHHQTVLGAVDLPIMLYAAPVGSGGMVYEPDLLAELTGAPQVVAIKEGSWEVAHYEANRRLVKSINPDCAVMASGDEHLFACFLVGTEGSQVSIACVVPELVVELYRAVESGDLLRARSAHARIYPLARAIYGTSPARHAHARLKTCLLKLGRISSDRVRPPIGPLSDREASLLEEALNEAVSGGAPTLRVDHV